MATTVTRLTNSGTFLVNGSFDEINGPVVTNGLQLWLEAENPNSYSGTGTAWRDLSGNGNNGTLVNSPTYFSASKGNGSYFSFGSGASQRTSFTYQTPVQSAATAFTWNIWAYPTANQDSYVLMGYRGTTPLQFYKLTTQKFEMYPAEIFYLFPLNQWNNICVVYDGSQSGTNNMKMYVNGLQVGLRDADQPDFSPSAMPFYVGGDPIAGEYATARISSVQVYNRALSVDEITQNYNARRQIFALDATSSTTVVGKISMNTNTVFASVFDEVTGMGFLPNMLTYFDAGKIESYNFNYDRQRLVDLSTSSRIVMQNTATWVSTFSGGLSYPVIPGTVSGAEPWVQLQDSVLNNRSSGTISAWIQYTAFSRSGDYHDNYGQAIVSRQRDSVGTWAHLAVSGYVNSSGAPLLGTTGKIYWHPRNGIAPANSTANLSYNTVYHIAVTFNTTECKFYINGSLDSTTAGDYSIPSSQESTYGTAVAVWRYGGEYYMPWSGYIYGMKFYNSVLSADQVAQNYNADAARFALTPITAPPVHRQSSTGTLLVTGLFDEFTGAPIVDSNLILHWDAGQSASYPGTGTSIYDLSGRNNTGTLNEFGGGTGGPTFSSADGGKLVFNTNTTTNQVYSSSSVLNNLSNNFSHETWFRGNGTSIQLFTSWYTADGAGNPVGAGYGYMIGNSGSNTWKVTKFNVIDIFLGTIPSDSKWHQAVVVYSSTAGTLLYIDGALSDSSANTSNVNSAVGLRFGYGHSGDISIVRMYNKVLTADEIAQNWNANRRRYGI